MAGNVVQVRVVLTNEDAVDAFSEACQLLEETLEDSPWLADVREALEKLRYAAERLQVVGE